LFTCSGLDEIIVTQNLTTCALGEVVSYTCTVSSPHESIVWLEHKTKKICLLHADSTANRSILNLPCGTGKRNIQCGYYASNEHLHYSKRI